MKLSILDQSPVSANQTAKEALNNSITLAKLGDKLGYERYWIAEHHDLFGLACPNPDVMIGIISSQTKQIKVGAGAVLLPYYKPFRVAETYNLLATLFPKRIDLGLGRAPGGSAEVSMALSDNYLEQVRQFPDDVKQLMNFLNQSFPDEHMYAKIKPTPVPKYPPNIWMLGTSERSAKLAAELGMHYTFGHFMTDQDGPNIAKVYRENYSKTAKTSPYLIVAVHVLCAKSDEQAEKLAQNYLHWTIEREQPGGEKQLQQINSTKLKPLSNEAKQKVHDQKQSMVIGSPNTVYKKLKEIQTNYNADEIMIITINYDHKDTLNSYQLVAEKILK